MSRENPCLTCGACCAHFRVSFYWGEADPAQGGDVPPALTEDLTGFRRCMLGTNQHHPRCVALQGAVGTLVSCAIYDQRPSPCREFGVHWQDGAVHLPPGELDRCTSARAAYGLSPLSEAEFLPPVEPSIPLPVRPPTRPAWRRSRRA